jgi:glycosyltransferase involved in cell wall biosynthesis
LAGADKQATAPRVKVAQLINVDFALNHFVLPLMREIRARGHEVLGICADGPLLATARAEGFRIVPAPFQRSYDLLAHARSYRFLTRLFREEKFDLLHVHTPLAALIGRLAGRAAGIPRIAYTAHGFYFHDRMAWPQKTFHIGLERLGARATDILMTQSSEDAETAIRLGLAPGGVAHAIGNGVDVEKFRPDPSLRAAVRAELGTPDDAVVAVMTGRLVAEKGYPELFRAAAQVPTLHLWCVGSRLASDHADPIGADIAAAQAAMGPRLHLLGYRPDVHRLLAAADLFTLPSHREGMPRSIIEAMATALPVVATDIRGSREEVVQGETGLLVPVGDVPALAAALARLASDAEMRAGMGAAGRARALELYDERKVIARQIQILGL